jgi:outer membrane lipoprotein SlyB
MRIKNLTMALFTVLLLTGCVTTAEKIKTNTDDFFSQKPANGNAVVYFTCGTMITKSPFGDFDMDYPYCNYIINSDKYMTLEKGTVGKLSLSPGEYSISQNEDDNEIKSTIKVNSGDVLVITANHTVHSGLFGGLIGGLTSKYIFEIEASKSINTVVNKIPVVMTIDK